MKTLVLIFLLLPLSAVTQINPREELIEEITPPNIPETKVANPKAAPIREKIPEIGVEPVPQLQENDGQVINPFAIGPYDEGKYQFTNPNRDQNETSEGI